MTSDVTRAARMCVVAMVIVPATLACNARFAFPDEPSVGDAAADALAAGETWNCGIDTECKLSVLRCDQPSGSCVECTRDEHCAGTTKPRCDLALHRCVECGSPIDCLPGQVCEAATRRCVRACGDGSTCLLDAPICDVTRGLCVRCFGDTQCLGSDGECLVAAGKCVQCLESSQCGAPTARCDPVDRRCVECAGPADCSNGRVCDPRTGACVLP